MDVAVPTSCLEGPARNVTEELPQRDRVALPAGLVQGLPHAPANETAVCLAQPPGIPVQNGQRRNHDFDNGKILGPRWLVGSLKRVFRGFVERTIGTTVEVVPVDYKLDTGGVSRQECIRGERETRFQHVAVFHLHAYGSAAYAGQRLACNSRNDVDGQLPHVRPAQ